MRKICKIGEVLGQGLYAERTEAGGFRFYDDSVGVLNMFLDTTLLDKRFLDLALSFEPYIDQHWEAIVKNAEFNDECLQLEDQ